MNTHDTLWMQPSRFHTESPSVRLYLKRFHTGGAFEERLCSEANHICPITAWPAAAVGAETE